MSWESVSYWIEHHPGLASWVQAVGSVAAILVAIYIASGQTRKAGRDKREQDRVVLEGLIVMAERAGHAVKRLYEQTSPNKSSAEDMAYVQASYQAFISINMLSLPTIAIFTEVMKVRNNLEVALQQAELTHQYLEKASQENAHGMVNASALLIAGAILNLKLLRSD